MLNGNVIDTIYARPEVKLDIKKRKLVPAKRKSSREIGGDIAGAVLAAIKEEGPICVAEIVKITHYSQNSIRQWIEKINVDSVFTVDKRAAGGRARRVAYYSMVKS